jgi:prepilin-type N-terminal cleavage/methylation domain-containing protein
MLRPITKNMIARKGFSLVEVMASVAILIVAVIGTSGFRYYTALQERQAAKQIASARIALTLCESWRGMKGLATFNPAASLSTVMTIQAGSGPATPAGFTSLGGYEVQADGANYYARLSWQDINTDLRAMNVIVAWSQTNDQAEFGDTDKSFALTTYTQK